MSNIFINNLLKDYKIFKGCFSKDQIQLIENNKSIIMNLQNSNQPGSHSIGLKRLKKAVFLSDSFGVGFLPIGVFKVFKNLKMITNIYIEFKILTVIYVECFVYYLFYMI